MGKWTSIERDIDVEAIGKEFKVSRQMATLLGNRGLIDTAAVHQYLYGSLEDLADARDLRHMEKAVSILSQKIREGATIRIMGDYDIDGICGTYILQEGCRLFGAKVDTDIPDRITDGYGLSQEMIKRAFRDGIDTIVTCDNGIATFEEIALAKEYGMTVIVTDHHEVFFEMDEEGNKTYRLPCADAVIDPKQEDCSYPFKELCGAVVAYKLVEALALEFHVEKEAYFYLLETAALATIGDIMPLVGENRIIVKAGMRLLQNTKNKGLRALIQCCGLEGKSITPGHVGFILGPCLNAGGRLDSAKKSLALLQANTEEEAKALAQELQSLNETRKALTVEAVSEALKQIEEKQYKEDLVLVVYLPNCHESIAGIVAGRLKESLYRPAIVLTRAEGGVKGSGRSVEGYSLYDALVTCDDLLGKYGGHKMAAGLTLEEDKISLLRERLNEKCTLTKEDLVEKVDYDFELPFGELTESFIQELTLLEPLGMGNRKPVFVAKGLRILKATILGANQNVLKLFLRDRDGLTMDAIQFGEVDRFFEWLQNAYPQLTRESFLQGETRMVQIDIAYYPTINEFRGRRNMQAVISHIN